MRLTHRACVATCLIMLAAVPAVGAQEGPPEVVRGRVTDDSSRALAGATVMVTRGPDRLTQPGTTDATGHYVVRFAVGTGDYLVYVSAPGYKPVRRRVQRQGNEHEFVAEFRLVPDVATLATVKVTAVKPERAENRVDPMNPEAGSSERWTEGVEGQVSPSAAGDLSAIAGTMSNVTMGPNGPSILGAGGESNLTTLNGMSLAGGSIPRAANTMTRVTGATFDATRGGFSGAAIDVQLGPGDRFNQNRRAFLTFDPPALQFTDRTGRSAGLPTGGLKVSLGADGELIRQALTYNIALDVGRGVSSPATLLSADAEALVRAGVAPDSVSRLVAVAGPLGLPLGGGGIRGQRQRDVVTWLARLDDTRDTLSTRALTTYAGLTRDGAFNFGPLSAPSTAGQQRDEVLGTQLTLGSYVGEGRRILTETRFAASAERTHQTPYDALPGATVLVRSPGVGDAGDVSAIALGGGSYLGGDDSRWTLEGGNETTWQAVGHRHRFKASLWGRADGLRREGSSNALGTFGFNSIADLEAGHPASFTRTLSQPVREGSTWNGAAALSHQFAPSRWFSLLYGARLEADGFSSAPAANPVLEQALGVPTGAAPMRLHVSPRIGFTYTYNRDRDNGSGANMSGIGRFFRTPVGTLRGGIGEFRDLLRPGLLADASAATGLPGATSVLSCVGSAVPAVDWSGFASDPGTIPTQCVDGSGPLAELAPSVTLIDPAYDVPRSWRASLDWSTSTRGLLLKVGGLLSYDLSQPGVVDANFSGVQKLTLPDEAGRPVYVTAAGIDPASGEVSATTARRNDAFGRVGTRVSDLRGVGSQLTLSLAPDLHHFRGAGSLYGALNYTLQQSRRQYRGFDGGGFGDPRAVEWSAGPNDARHILVLTAGYSAPKVGTLTLFARAQSGLPFTPLVQGDVNGDGGGGDRAFIPDPDNPRTDPALAAQLRSLLATGSSSATACLHDNLGKVVERNGCRGPWTQSLNVQWRPRMPQRWDHRVTPTVYLENVLGGIDQALHGSAPRGWGRSAVPDPVLLVPRGFVANGPDQGRFLYDVNPRFADTRPSHTLLRNPFRITIDISLELSTDYSLQQLRRAVEPVRTPAGWQRRSADSLLAFYLSRTSNVHKLLLEESDSLFLSRAQVTALQRADSAYSVEVRAIYRPLAEFLARGAGEAGKAELDSVETAQAAYWKVFWKQPDIADSIVTPVQRELVPMFQAMVSIPQPEREGSRWFFGHPVELDDKHRGATAPSSNGMRVRIP